MTKQTLISEQPSREASAPIAVAVPIATRQVEATSYHSRLLEAMKAQYQLDQQVKFLHLQAEAESLLQQLKLIQQQRQTATIASKA